MMEDEINQTELDRIAEEFSLAIRRGESPSIDTFLDSYPDTSGQLRELLESVALIEGLKRETGSIEPTREPSLNIKQLDDYTIVREIGRGGMGVVFEAIHQSLGRRVAVKVLANHLLNDTKHLTRFRREARAAARLRHSNIVPVYGVGQSENHHYYVMDLIDGMSLKDWQAGLSDQRRPELPTIDVAHFNTQTETSNSEVSAVSDTDRQMDAAGVSKATPFATDSKDYFHWVAHLGATMCDALQYAHTQGVLHRDIKPANLLVDRKNEVWIADFGLAKLSEQQAVTMTGEVIGTPQYMPPESFDGTYDIKSEVYAAGLTLYELLALRPAIDGKNTGDTIRKATAGVSISPRKYNSSIPRDLETIVLKSLSHNPSERYQSTGELRDDLHRYLLDRPIAARRTGLLERAVRWSRREPVVASLTFATFGLLSALAVVSAYGYVQTKSALSTAEAATRSAEQSLTLKTDASQVAEDQRVRAEKNLQVALAAFDQTMQNITDRGLETDADVLGEVTDTTAAGVTPEDAKLLQTLLGFFDELAANNSEDLLAESAVAAQRAGDIYMSLGKLSQADRAYSDCLDRYAKLSQLESEDSSFTISRATVMNQLAVIASLRGQLARSFEMFSSTTELLESSEPALASHEGRFQYARAHRLFASLGSRSGTDGLQQPQGVGLIPRRPASFIMKLRAEQEFESLEKAIEVLGTLIQESPDDIRFQAELARVYRDKAKVASRAKRKSDAEEAVKESIDRFEKLLSENKTSDAVRYELAMTLISTEAPGFDQRQRAARADELSNQLLANSPALPRYMALKAQSLENLALLQSRAGESDLAVRNLIESIQIYSSLIAESPELSLYETRRSQALESVADIKISQGKTQEAIDFLERAIRRLQPSFRQPQMSPVARMQFQRMRQKLARLKESQ